MERLAILDHETHTLYVEDVSDETLAKYDGEEEDYIEDNYALEDYSWDYIAATVYTAPDGEIITGVDFAKPTEDIQKFNIQTPLDVGKFFIWIVFEKHINFHPDDSFGEYENIDKDEPTFSLEEANYYDEVMRQCFVVCEKFERDIYKLAQLVMGTYCYCDCNDTMAKFCLGEWD